MRNELKISLSQHNSTDSDSSGTFRTLQLAAAAQKWPTKITYFVLAAICLLLGVLGIFLPGLPTTPFLLLMGFFLVRVSPQLHRRVLLLPLVGKPIREWQEKSGVRPAVKTLAFSMVIILVVATWLFRDLLLYAKIGITIAGIIGGIVVYCLPTIRDNDSQVS